MKSQKNKLPVAQKLIMMMAIIMLLVNGALSYLIQGVMRTSLTNVEHKYLSEIVKNIGNTSVLTVQEYVAICEVLAVNDAIIQVLLDSDENNPMNIHPYAEAVSQEMNFIMEKFDDSIMSMAIFDLETDGFLLNTGEISGDEFSFRERPYYDAVLTGKYVVTEPYLDVLTDGLVVTIGCPVVLEEQMLGVVGLDLPIDFLAHLVVNSSYGDTGRTMVLDHNNVILAYADPSYINENFDVLGINSAELRAEFEQPTGNLVNYVYDGEHRLGIVAHIEELDWRILTAMDYAEFDQISSFIIVTLFVSVLFTFLVCSQFISGKMNETISQLNNQDGLTGLNNRTGYSYKLEEIMKTFPKTIGFLSINVNGLKEINEKQGEKAGDARIQEVAQRLSDHFDFEIFRMAGAEFVGIAPNISLEHFEEQISSLTKVMQEEGDYSFSLGHAWSSGRNDVTRLNFEAETLMYINKQEYYANHQDSFVNVTDSLLGNLLRYLKNDEFLVYLQPQVHLFDGSLYGAEALIRRYDKTDGKMVFPDQFIPQYEQNSIIRHVDLFVVDAVCQLLAKWVKREKYIPISVNLSRVTLQEYGIVRNIVEICDKYRVPHHLLVIEVTERVGLVENNVASSLIRAFKENGFHISLDDFGCAYSNIVTLAQIEVDEVKIDKSLVDNLTTNRKNNILVKNILSMCNELEGISTLAEGIEDEDQAKLLHELECQIGQGYFFSRPIPVEEFEEKYIID